MIKPALLTILSLSLLTACNRPAEGECEPNFQKNCSEVVSAAATPLPEKDSLPKLFNDPKPATASSLAIQASGVIASELIQLPASSASAPAPVTASSSAASEAHKGPSLSDEELLKEQEKTVSKDDLL